MPEFIAKLQYKNYEKGEFDDEKVHNPAEIIQLVKDFPWETEREADIQLTGPSVTIRNDNIEYLKIGLYFNGKFAVYYLDQKDHLYEAHAATLDDALHSLEGFLAGNLSLDSFDKHLFNIGNRAHFETGYFVYRYSAGRFLWVNLFLLIYLTFPLIGLIAVLILFKAVSMIIFFLILMSVIGFPFGLIARFALKNRRNYLELSKGHDVFSFGLSENDVKTYNKKDIRDIVIYSTRGSRSAVSVEIYDINLKSGKTLRLSNMLISGFIFTSKFSNNLDNPLVNIIYSNTSLLRILGLPKTVMKTNA